MWLRNKSGPSRPQAGPSLDPRHPRVPAPSNPGRKGLKLGPPLPSAKKTHSSLFPMKICPRKAMQLRPRCPDAHAGALRAWVAPTSQLLPSIVQAACTLFPKASPEALPTAPRSPTHSLEAPLATLRPHQEAALSGWGPFLLRKRCIPPVSLLSHHQPPTLQKMKPKSPPRAKDTHRR